jgi:phospholipase C
MPAPNLDQIQTIVIVMMENRSFDHMLGYLALEEEWKDVDGVKPSDPTWVARTTNEYDGQSYAPFVQTNVTGKMTGDPPHEWADIARQMGHRDANGEFPMNGFVENYANAREKPRIISKTPVMGYFTGKQLPVTDRLARNCAVCDHWFSSLPAGTQANRLMGMAGYSLIAHNTVPLPNHSLVYDWLDERKVNWRVYHEGLPFFAMMPNQIERILTSGNFRPLEKLWPDVDDESPKQFPEVIFIEPSYTDSPHLGLTRDDHAPSSIVGGQQFLNELYRSIRVNPNWGNTVMIITYDEHGGFFDHVSPPLVVTPAPGGNHSNPGFNSLGIRVPAIVVSPLVSAGRLYDKQLDHTSILKFLGEKFGQRNGKPPGYSPEVDAREVNSVYDVLDLAEPRVEKFVTAFPSVDAYLNQLAPPAGYLPGNSKPPTTLGEAFKFGLDSIRKHPAYTKGHYDDLLSAFPPDPITHLA